jgi:hypothetical protein
MGRAGRQTDQPLLHIFSCTECTVRADRKTALFSVGASRSENMRVKTPCFCSPSVAIRRNHITIRPRQGVGLILLQGGKGYRHRYVQNRKLGDSIYLYQWGDGQHWLPDPSSGRCWHFRDITTRGRERQEEGSKGEDWLSSVRPGQSATANQC